MMYTGFSIGGGWEGGCARLGASGDHVDPGGGGEILCARVVIVEYSFLFRFDVTRTRKILEICEITLIYKLASRNVID